jgi:hypothetical protein
VLQRITPPPKFYISEINVTTKRSTEMAAIRGRKRGRPKLTWAEGIGGMMEGKGLMEEDQNDRSKRRKKII